MLCWENIHACVSCYAEQDLAVRSMFCTKMSALWTSQHGWQLTATQGCIPSVFLHQHFPHQNKTWLGQSSLCGQNDFPVCQRVSQTDSQGQQGTELSCINALRQASGMRARLHI